MDKIDKWKKEGLSLSKVYDKLDELVEGYNEVMKILKRGEHSKDYFLKLINKSEVNSQ